MMLMLVFGLRSWCSLLNRKSRTYNRSRREAQAGQQQQQHPQVRRDRQHQHHQLHACSERVRGGMLGLCAS
jgi:hypothetical protein